MGNEITAPSGPLPNEPDNAAISLHRCDFPYYHTHGHYEMTVAVGEGVQLCANGKEELLSPGDCRLIAPGERHAIIFRKAAGAYIDLAVPSDLLGSVVDALLPDHADDPLPRVAHFTDETVKNAVETVFVLASLNPEKGENDRCVKLLAATLITELLLQNARPDCPGWFPPLLALLNDPRNDLNAEQIAAATPYSYSRLSRLFKAQTGVTLIEYIRNVKLDFACELLYLTDLSVAGIVGELHYESVSYFNHTFKDRFGISPLQYRKEARERAKD